MTNKLANAWMPPVLRSALNRAIGACTTYRGPFASWQEARASASGYDQAAILGRVSAATDRVLRGQGRYEQDGIVFRGEPPASHALAGLMLAAAHAEGRLSVLDLGGGLGSHYLRWRPLLDRLPSLRWDVVEQAGFVAEGNKLFAANPSIAFHESVGAIPSRPNAILASSVLQYLPDPYAVLRELVALGARTIVLDRMPYGNTEAVVAQFVPASLGGGSYPLWVLSRETVHGVVEPAYRLVAEFDAPDQPLRASRIRATHHGSIWLRRT